MIEEFEVSGALIITIAVTNTESCSTLEKQTLNLTVTALDIQFLTLIGTLPGVLLTIFYIKQK